MRDHQEIGRHRENAMQSVQMLRAVVGGETYETVGLRFGISRTAVGWRIKSIAMQLTQVVGVDGLEEEGVAFIRLLRLHRDARDPGRCWGSYWSDIGTDCAGVETPTNLVLFRLVIKRLGGEGWPLRRGVICHGHPAVFDQGPRRRVERFPPAGRAGPRPRHA